MNKIDVVKYLQERHKEGSKGCAEPGPLVTISREMGCPGTTVMNLLVNELNKRFQFKDEASQWKGVGKNEIQKVAAQELNLPIEEIEYLFDVKKKTMMEEILDSMSNKYYKSDRKVKSVVKEVIQSIACKGRVVILGRGGVAITRDIFRSLHIQLQAPLEWRTLRVSERFNFDTKEAERYVQEIDRKRNEFINYFGGINTDYTRFDITFNCMTLSVMEIVDIIINTMEIRKFIY